MYEKALTTKQKSKYPLSTCVVTGATLPEKPFDLLINNQLVRVVDEQAAKKFYENSREYLAKIDEAKKLNSNAPSQAPQQPASK